MSAILAIALKEVLHGLRNRWVLAATLLLAALALALALLGSTPIGTVGAAPLAVAVVSLASLTIFLVPLIALLLSYDALVGEQERGTLLLLLTYPLRRWQLLTGKFLGHLAILTFAITVAYGAAGLAIGLTPAAKGGAWGALGLLVGSSVLLGAAFVALGYLVSALASSRGAAGGLAVAVWLTFVLLWDLGLLGALVADQGRHLSAELFSLLLLANPADVYRLLNLTGVEATRELSGMIGMAGQASFSTPVLLMVLVAWTLLPLAAAAALFERKEL